MCFEVFLQFSFYPYNYYSELYMFDESVVVNDLGIDSEFVIKNIYFFLILLDLRT